MNDTQENVNSRGGGGRPMIAGLCAYCGKRPGVNRDHVVPRAVVKKGRPFSAKYRHTLNRLDESLLQTVPACYECNIHKGTRKLIPPPWADKIPALKEAIPGHWRVWSGDVSEPAFREVHK